MKRMLTTIFVLLITAGAMSSSCEKQPQTADKAETDTTVEFVNCNALVRKKNMNLAAWRETDTVSFYVIDPDAQAAPQVSRAYKAGPKKAGSWSARFPVDIPKEVEGSFVAATFTDPVSYDAPASVPEEIPAFDISGSTLRYTIPENQDGSAPIYLAAVTKPDSNAVAELSFQMIELCAHLEVSLPDGTALAGVTVSALGGEAVAGTLSYDLAQLAEDPSGATPEASSGRISVTMLEGKNTVKVNIAPGTYSRGLKLALSFAEGSGEVMEIGGPFTIARGATKSFSYFRPQDIKGTVLAACGSNTLNIIDAGTALEKGFTAGRLWRWVAADHKDEIVSGVTLDNLDECKAVPGRNAILVTSSYGWWAMVEYPSGKVLYSGKGTNTHSAEILPGNLIAVANSTGGDNVKLYSLDDLDTELASVPLYSAHGLVWMEKTKRLYAAGNYSVLVLKLTGEGTSKQGLELEKEIKSNAFGDASVYNIHDLTKVDESTLAVSGMYSSFLNVETEQMTTTPLQRSFSNTKSFNYNPSAGEAWYTHSNPPEGGESWSTQTLRHSTDLQTASDTESFKITSQKIYKVRVVKW